MEESRWLAFVPAHCLTVMCLLLPANCLRMQRVRDPRTISEVPGRKIQALCVVAGKSRMEPLCLRANTMGSTQLGASVIAAAHIAQFQDIVRCVWGAA